MALLAGKRTVQGQQFQIRMLTYIAALPPKVQAVFPTFSKQNADKERNEVPKRTNKTGRLEIKRKHRIIKGI